MPEDLPSRAPRRTSRVLALLLGGFVLIAGLTGGWSLASSFESPAQREASAKPPAAGAITAEAKRGDLTRSFSVDVKIARETSQPILIAGNRSPAVVTGLPVVVGQQFQAGDQLTEMNGQPVFLVNGAFPFYRDLNFGDSGRDVKELQTALIAQGARLVADGTFGRTTEAALKNLYKKHGYVAPLGGGTPTAPSTAPGTQVATPPSEPAVVAPHVTMAKNSFVVVSSFPAQSDGTLAVGQTIADDYTFGLSSGLAVARATAPAASLAGLKPGLAVTVTMADGTAVPSVAGPVGTPNADGAAAVTFTPSGAGFPDGAIGQDAVALVELESVAKDALIVPTAAVVTTGTKAAYVLVQQPDKTFMRVPVEEQASLDGETAVTVKTEGSLKPGSIVKVG